MLSTTNWGVRVCRQFLLAVGCVCLWAGNEVAAQSLHISDADVSLSGVVSATPGLRSGGVGGRFRGGSESERSGRGRGDGLLNRTSNEKPAELRLLEEAVYKEAGRYNIDPDLVFALIWQESSFRLNAVSAKNARGPLQLMPATARRFGVHNPHDPKEAVRGGVAYLIWLLDRFNGNVPLALAGYNAGEASVEAYLKGKTIVLSDGRVINPRAIRTGGIPPYVETVNYVRRIAERYRRMRAARALSSVAG